MDESFWERLNDVLDQKINSILDQKLNDFKIEIYNKMDEKFEKLESRMDKLESRMDNLESRMDNLESRMDKLEQDLTNRMDKLEQDIHKEIIDRMFVFEEEYGRRLSIAYENINSRSQKEKNNEENIANLYKMLEFNSVYKDFHETRLSDLERRLNYKQEINA